MKFDDNQRLVVNTRPNQAIPLSEANATHTTASTEQWALVTNPHPMFADWHLEHRTGFNTNLDNTPTSDKMYSCARFAFFKLSEAAAFTYDYKINGTSVKTEEKVVKIGDSYPALATMPDFCAATAPTGNVDQADHNQTKDITVTWSAPFQFSTTINDAHFYYIMFVCN